MRFQSTWEKGPERRGKRPRRDPLTHKLRAAPGLGFPVRRVSYRLGLRRLIDGLPLLLVPVKDAAFTVALDGKVDDDLSLRAGLDIEVRFLAGAHARDEVVDVAVHHVLAVVDGNLDLVQPELVVLEHRHFGHCRCVSRSRLWPTSGLTVMWSVVASNIAVVHHDDGALVAADQARDVLRVRHGGTQHQRVALGVFRHQVEGVRHFALVLELPRKCRRCAITLCGNCGSPQQMFSGATTWKNRSVAMPPE